MGGDGGTVVIGRYRRFIGRPYGKFRPKRYIRPVEITAAVRGRKSRGTRPYGVPFPTGPGIIPGMDRRNEPNEIDPDEIEPVGIPTADEIEPVDYRRTDTVTAEIRRNRNRNLPEFVRRERVGTGWSIRVRTE